MEKCFTSDGNTYNMRTYAQDFYVHLREGHIVPVQDAFKTHANTTYDLSFQPVDLHINPKPTPWEPSEVYWEAYGIYINDDGEVANIEGNYNEYTFIV